MMRNLIQSERQKPRALELLKAIYAAHNANPCGLGERCPVEADLKARIKALEDANVKPTVSWNSEVD